MRTLTDLKMLQSLPLEVKVAKSKQRIREWVEYYGEQNCNVSFSGGKDSTVLLHLVRQEYPQITAVFVDTGLEYPEIKQFIKTFDNVTIIRPKLTFRQVIERYGYPIISKEVAQRLQDYRRCIESGFTKYKFAYDKFNGNIANPNTGKKKYL